MRSDPLIIMIQSVASISWDIGSKCNLSLPLSTNPKTSIRRLSSVKRISRYSDPKWMQEVVWVVAIYFADMKYMVYIVQVIDQRVQGN